MKEIYKYQSWIYFYRKNFNFLLRVEKSINKEKSVSIFFIFFILVSRLYAGEKISIIKSDSD